MIPNQEHTLNDKMTILELQASVREMCLLNGWDKDAVEIKYLLFSEEVGELAKAIRRHRHIYDEEGKKDEELAEEFADVLSYLADLANITGVDLTQALLKKEQKNLKREWKH